MQTLETLAKATATNNAFSHKTPGLQLTWDTGSLADLKTCPRLYYLKMIEGWTPKGENPHLLFGLICHSAIETYDKALVKGISHEEGVRLAVRHVLEKTGRKQSVLVCTDCNAETDNMKSVMCLACSSDQLVPFAVHKSWTSDHPNKNLYTLLRTVVWYLEHYKDSHEEIIILANGSPAVEIWFRFEIPLLSPKGEQYILSGHIDKLIKIGIGKWFKDIKTTKYQLNSQFFEKFSPDNQMSFYNAGGNIVFEAPLLGGIIDGAQVLVNSTRFQRGMVQRTKAQLEEWIKDTQVWLHRAEDYAKEMYWPANDTACHHYGGCDFKDICNKDPAVRERFLKTHFKKRVWDPTKERT